MFVNREEGLTVSKGHKPEEDKVTYSDYYTIACCPNCQVVIHDEDQARYYDRCCKKCGHTNGSLFYVSYETVRDKLVNGKRVDTIVKEKDNPWKNMRGL